MRSVGLIEYIKIKIKNFFKMKSISPTSISEDRKVTATVKDKTDQWKTEKFIYVDGQKLASTLGDDIFIINGKRVDINHPDYAKVKKEHNENLVKMHDLLINSSVDVETFAKNLENMFK